MKRAEKSIIARAFDDHTLDEIVLVKKAIFESVDGQEEQAFFLTALMSLLERFSRTQKSGGWLKITDTPQVQGSFIAAYNQQLNVMLQDIRSIKAVKKGDWKVITGDARDYQTEVGKCDAIISFPPYLNRHDYTRVLCLELLVGCLENYNEITDLRHNLLRSHVEAKPRIADPEYKMPQILQDTLDELKMRKAENRVLYIVNGYFEDMYSVLKTSKDYLKSGGHIAFVLGNVRFSGLPILVDDIMVAVGNQLGLEWEQTLIARKRNNSAQQMRDFGRDPSRESVILWRRID